MDFILPFIIALAVVVIIRLLAGTDNIIGHICRAFWNISFKIVAFIPFMGWMSHFIIADTDAEIRAKESYVETGRTVDSMAYDAVDAAAKRQLEQKKERERLRLEIQSRLDRTDDVVVSDTAEFVRINGKDYTVQEVKNMLNF